MDDAQLLRKPYVSTTSSEEREYFVYLPRGYETRTDEHWPVMLFLHGGGERGDGGADLDLVLKHGPLKEAWTKQRDLGFVIIAPQMPPLDEASRRQMQARVEDRPATQARLTREATGVAAPWDGDGPPLGWWAYEADVLHMVDATLRDYRTDADRVYLTGLSYGGFGAWHLAAAHPSRWAAVAPVCGAGRTDCVGAIADARLPIWIFTGGRDRVIRPEWVMATAAALEAAGHPDVRFTVHEDRNHDVWSRVYAGEDFYHWLLRQRRG